MAKKILVTGGAGYVGSVLVRELLARNYQVRVFDKLYFGRASLSDLLNHPNFELIQGDIRELDKFEHILDGIDGVIHLASLSNDPSCDLDPELSRAINYTATENLADLCIRAAVKRFIFSSTCSVYGSGAGRLLDEKAEPAPISLYAKTKLMAEISLLNRVGSDFEPVILRNATTFGLSPRMRFDLAINTMTLFAMTRGKIFILEGGQQWRPFIHLKDLARAFILVLEAPSDKVAGEIFNIGGFNFQIIKLAELVKSHFPAVELIYTPSDPDKRDYKVNFDKVFNILGFKPIITPDEGVEEIKKAIEDGVLTDLDADKYFNLRLIKKILNLPATKGGERLRAKFLPFAQPLIGKEEEEEVLDSLRSGWITTGPKVARFEQMFKEYIGCKHAQAVNSCTAALHLSLISAGIKPGDEVITSPITFAATANVIIHCGAVPVFADVEKETLNIDVGRIEEKITEKTKAIIPVHLAGQPCKMKEIFKIARKYNLKVIEDAAHAVGAEYDGKKIGSLSEYTCFSFYPIKNITTIEGGMITFDNDDLEETLKALTLHGLTKDAWNRYTAAGSLHWDILFPGYKYNMTDIQAALGIHQLKKLPLFLEVRRKYVSIYQEAFRDMEELQLLQTIPEATHSHHLFIILLNLEKLTITRDEFMLALKDENIGTGVHFRAIPFQTYYRQRFGYKKGDFPIAEWASERIVSLPLYPKMSEYDVLCVISAVKKILNYYKK